MPPHPARLFAKVGLLLQLGLVAGVAATYLMMMRTFEGITVFGTGDPEQLSRGISGALIFTGIGIMVAFPGMLLFLVAVLTARLRERWVLGWGLFAAALWLPLIWFGTVVGIVALLALIWNILRPGTQNPPAPTVHEVSDS